MPELVDNYFEGHLSQADQDALGALLDGSPEAAEAFSGRALEEYRAMGLPEASWPSRRARFKGAGWIWALALAAGTGAAWVVFSGPDESRPSLAIAGGEFSYEPYHPQAADQPAPPQHPGAPRAEADELPGIAPEAPRLALQARPRPGAAAQGLARGHRLSVQVRQATPGQVQVVVRDPQGRDMRRLFDGRLEPGSWKFEWDGRDEAGQDSTAGDYSIVVKRGGSEQVKQVALRRNGS